MVIHSTPCQRFSEKMTLVFCQIIYVHKIQSQGKWKTPILGKIFIQE